MHGEEEAAAKRLSIDDAVLLDPHLNDGLSQVPRDTLISVRAGTFVSRRRAGREAQ